MHLAGGTALADDRSSPADTATDGCIVSMQTLTQDTGCCLPLLIDFLGDSGRCGGRGGGDAGLG